MFRSITVGELKRIIEGEENDAIVTFSSDYGDYHHTKQVHELEGNIDELPIDKSGYSQSGYAIVDYDRDDDEPEDDFQRVLVLS
jgi:hypothetical protein